MTNKALIVGSETEDRFSGLEERRENTEYGPADYMVDGNGIIILPRHGFGHKKSPGNINYKANASLLKEKGVKYVITTHAVGSITQKLVPTHIGLISDFIDFTHRRDSSFFSEDGKVIHTEMTKVFSDELKFAFLNNALKVREKIVPNLTYITTEGPRFESPAEIKAFRLWGADIVGMTLNPEVNLLHELGLSVLSVAFSINWASGLDEEGLSFIEKESMKRLSDTLIDVSIKTLESIG